MLKTALLIGGQTLENYGDVTQINDMARKGRVPNFGRVQVGANKGEIPMNLEKFTERSRGFIQAAQTIATRENHQRLVPEHLLKALMDDDQGLASNLIKAAGGTPESGPGR